MLKTVLGYTTLWVSRMTVVVDLLQKVHLQEVGKEKRLKGLGICLFPVPLTLALFPTSTRSQIAFAVGVAQNVPTYLDDRSNPVQLLKSYYNAINRKEYVRAYYYWGQNGNKTTSQPPPYPQFEAGYGKTKAVQLTTGKVTSEGAAGTFYFQVPVTLIATQTNGSKQAFVGCYTIRQPNPAVFGAPPFIPMHIYSAKIQQVPKYANTAQLMQQSCSQS